METVISLVTDIRAPVLYALIALVVFAETAVLLGMVLPGETAAIVAGVLASQHQISLNIAIPIVVLGAIGGDSVGYTIGRRFGPSLLERRLLRRRKPQVERASQTLLRRGGLIIVVSRFLPFLRTVTPAAAGVARKPYLAFLSASVAGGVLWGLGCPLLGYVAADSYQKVEEIVGRGGIAVLAVLALGAWAGHMLRRRRAGQETPAEEELTTVELAAEPPVVTGSVTTRIPRPRGRLARPHRSTRP